jgi:hypothetical protein
MDPNAVQNLAYANQTGYLTDTYMNLCVNKSATEQVNTLVANLQNSTYGILWIEVVNISAPGCNWTTSPSVNCNYLYQLIKAIQS